MSSVWLCLPSARPPEQVEPVLARWKERGYKIALYLNEKPPYGLYSHLNIGVFMWPNEGDSYPGYARAVNSLVRIVSTNIDSSADWFVTGGDDTLPDPNKTASEIAAQCSEHFANPDINKGNPHYAPSTFGVMQPTGDRFAHGSIDRIAGSPWMGREWCLRANQGKGPFWPEFTHMFSDEALKRTAEKLGVYWMRPDLIHFHHHFMRESDAIDSKAVPKAVPEHLKQWNTQQHWDEMKAIFRRLEMQDFAPCMPL